MKVLLSSMRMEMGKRTFACCFHVPFLVFENLSIRVEA